VRKQSAAGEAVTLRRAAGGYLATLGRPEQANTLRVYVTQRIL
jgi:hypothetical protein